MFGELGGVTFVGTAGSITTLAAMAQKLSTYEPIRIHNYKLGLDAIRGLEREILGRTKAQRREMPGLEAGREDVVVAGTLILHGVMKTLGFSEGLVSDVGLREGVLLDLAARRKR
jgi:exopolyphosphatase/guanosine-5'-triphosphate,3'-diphosphate pyrophosphatase